MDGSIQQIVDTGEHTASARQACVSQFVGGMCDTTMLVDTVPHIGGCPIMIGNQFKAKRFKVGAVQSSRTVTVDFLARLALSSARSPMAQMTFPVG